MLIYSTLDKEWMMYPAVACPADTLDQVHLLRRCSDSLISLEQGMGDVSCWVIIYLISRSGFTERGKKYESDVHRHRVINCQGVRCW